jgi:hypothetical protein
MHMEFFRGYIFTPREREEHEPLKEEHEPLLKNRERGTRASQMLLKKGRERNTGLSFFINKKRGGTRASLGG